MTIGNTINPEDVVPPCQYETKDPCDWCKTRARWIGVTDGVLRRACPKHAPNLEGWRV